VSALFAVVLGILGSIIAAELLSFCPSLTNILLAAAARRLPPTHGDRYLREWWGDLDALRASRGNLAIVCWATGIYLSSPRLARIVAGSDAKTAPALVAPRSMYDRRYRLLEPQQSFYDDLIRLQVDHDITLSTLDNLTHDPRAIVHQTVDGSPVYVRRVPANKHAATSDLVFAYTYSEQHHTVRMLYVACDETPFSQGRSHRS
jgi:hypothetical protein